MSIPPLVCSTPPPPEQCEDDKDHEEYDFQYNMQPDEDEDCLQYNYCHYSTRNIYDTQSDCVEKVKTNENIDDKILPQDKPPEEDIYCENVSSPVKVTIDNLDNTEENAVEDLNLMVSETVLQTNNSNVNKHDIDTDILNKDDCEETSIQDQGGTDTINTSEDNNDLYALPPDSLILTTNEDFKPFENNIIENTVDDLTPVDDVKVSDESRLSTEPTINEITTFSIAKDNLEKDPVVDNEFGDFDDFQFTTSENTIRNSNVTSENPWENREVDCSELGDFQANFDDFHTVATDLTEKDVNPTENIIISEAKINLVVSNEDDFGDFDDFQSSVKIASEETISANDILNFPSSKSDLQIVENVNSVLTSIFVEDTPEPVTEFDVKLESILGETWGHLIDTDVRQPYMVYWNNSLGQKVMLKALCIDSRNILFGPKWNMPKFALNLGTAPLQPQKQQSHLHIPKTDSNEKTTSKDTWTDPFTPQGQEYTYAEALLLDLEHLMATLDQMAHKHSTLKISELLSHACITESEKPVVKPKDLENFTSEVPTNITKIYSSTLSVQPLRQINLPDTHIFTPTDSETPRSKTIHYDSSPSNISSKSDLEVNDNILSPPIHSSSQLSTKQVTNSLSDNEDWDFQGFKGNTDTNINSVQNEKAVINSKCDNVSTPSGDYKTQLLQPIKLEPVIPTLNWPDPGEVKETFYDFSDFVSNTSWSDSKQESSVSNQENLTSTVKADSIIKEDKIITSLIIENNEDEFETFQSAPAPSTSNFVLQNVTQVVPISSDTLPNKIDNFNKPNLTTNSDVDKKLHDGRQQNQPIIADANKVTINKDVVMQPSVLQSSYQINCSDILQPSNAGSSTTPRNQQNSVQILQPLSLESFSQINWPNPGIDLQDLSRFNPIESVHSLKSDTSTSGPSKVTSPIHNSVNTVNNEVSDDDVWGDFVSSAPKPQPPTSKTLPSFADDDEWTDFVSSPNIKPQNGLSTISLNVHTNLNLQKSNQIRYPIKNNQPPLDIPTLNYITPKSSNRSQYTEKHFQNL